MTRGAALLGATLAGCGGIEPQPARLGGGHTLGRLTARPASSRTAPRGTFRVGLDTLRVCGRDVLLRLPAGYSPDRPAPLAVTLHGAAQSAHTGIAPLAAHADALGLLLVSPKSVGATWDFIGGPFGPDVAALDETLRRLFRAYAVDPARLALTGFSDGASYALSLGLTNGDLFTRVVAFSPGLFATVERRGRPAVFVSHGTRDRILDIDRASRRIVPTLRDAGYAVTYREFDGPHAVPPEIASDAAHFIAS